MVTRWLAQLLLGDADRHVGDLCQLLNVLCEGGHERHGRTILPSSSTVGGFSTTTICGFSAAGRAVGGVRAQSRSALRIHSPPEGFAAAVMAPP
jgi:hypothetical protein